MRSKYLGWLIVVGSLAAATNVGSKGTMQTNALISHARMLRVATSEINIREAQPDLYNYSIPGDYLKAFVTALAMFNGDESMKPKQKSLENYEIGFRDGDGIIVIRFICRVIKTLPEGEGNMAIVIGETEDCREQEFRIDRVTHKVLRRTYFE